MASHLSDIGFSLRGGDDIDDLVQRARREGQVVAAAAGHYVQWQTSDGPEIWVGVDEQSVPMALNPHFDGPARMRVAITSRMPSPEYDGFAGAFQAWAEPFEDDGDYQGTYPFLFNAPDFARLDGLELPAMVDIQLAAFAETLRASATQEEYVRSSFLDTVFAAESFIPIGLFKLDDDDSEHIPRPEALFAGHVLQTELRTNAATGERYHWALVQTLGGQADVVADPEIVEGSLIVGGIIQGVFWLTARIVEPGAA